MGSGVDAAEGFEAFYRERRGWLVRALDPIVGAEAEDVAQDAFLELYRRWAFVSRYDVPAAWLRRVAIRAAVRRRTRTADRARLEALADRLGRSPRDPAEVLLTSALAALSDGERDVLVQRHLLDRPIGEIAERLGTTEGAARVRLHRARQRAEESLAGLRGTWVMARRWERTALAAALRERADEDAVTIVMDDLEECGEIRTHLRLEDGRFLLTNREDVHLDHGRYVYAHGRLTLHSDGYPGGVTHAVEMDGNVMVLRQLENRNPVHLGAPDDAFQFALLGSSPMRWQPSGPRSDRRSA